MKKFFTPNLDLRSRLVRRVGGGVLVLGDGLVCHNHGWAGMALFVFGGFMLFEASRGWAVMRACRIKTKL